MSWLLYTWLWPQSRFGQQNLFTAPPPHPTPLLFRGRPFHGGNFYGINFIDACNLVSDLEFWFRPGSYLFSGPCVFIFLSYVCLLFVKFWWKDFCFKISDVKISVLFEHYFLILIFFPFYSFDVQLLFPCDLLLYILLHISIFPLFFTCMCPLSDYFRFLLKLLTSKLLFLSSRVSQIYCVEMSVVFVYQLYFL